MPEKSNLILSHLSAKRAQPGLLSVRSLMKAHYDGQIALLLDETVTDEVARLFRPYPVELLRYEADEDQNLESLGENRRFYGFQRYLRRKECDPSQVLIVDLGRSCFQSDPFRICRDEKQLCCIAGALERTIGVAPEVCRWIYYLYGAEKLWEVASEPALTEFVLGPRDTILRYLELMSLNLEPLKGSPIGSQPLSGAIHQLVIQLALKAHSQILDRSSAEVILADQLDAADFQFSKQGAVHVDQGKRPAVFLNLAKHPILYNYFTMQLA